MTKEDSKLLQEYLSSDSKFTFYKGMSFEKHPSCGYMSENSFQMWKLKDYLGLDTYDAFTLYAVYSMGHATSGLVRGWLNVQKRHFPNKAIPIFTSAQAKERLEKLASKGLLYCCDYVTRDKKVVLLYTCTKYGYTYFKNTLDISYIPFDENLIYHAEVESFKRLSAASIVLGLAKYKNSIAAAIGGKVLFGKNLKQRSLFTYGWTIIDQNGVKKLYIVEPINFSINESVISQAESIERTSVRMWQFENLCLNCKKEMNIPVIPIFCVENLDGLQRFCTIAKERKGTDIYQNCLYTSENVVYHFEGNMNKVFTVAQFERKGDETSVLMNPIGEKWCDLD